MVRMFQRFLFVLSAVMLFGATQAFATRGGRVFSTNGCGNCHGNQSANTTTTIEGPTSVRPRVISNYTFVVGHANNDYAGFNIDASGGTLGAQAGTDLRDGQLTHNGAPIAFNAGNTARIDFMWTAPANHGTYTFSAAGNAVNNNFTDDDGDDWNTTTKTITVIGATFTSPAIGTKVCAGNSLTITWTQTGLGNVRIEGSGNNFGTIDVIATNISAASGTYTWNIPANQAASATYKLRIVDATDITCGVSPDIDIAAGPRITTQPLSVTECLHETVTLSVAAQGVVTGYQWLRNGANIAGATTNSYLINALTADNAGTYEVKVFGCNTSTTSEKAVIGLKDPPKITTQLPATKQLCEGDSLKLSVTATGTGLRYVWKRNGAEIDAINSPNLVVSSLTIFEEGDYTCRVIGSCLPAIESQVCKVDVVEAVAIKDEPTSKTITEGDSLIIPFTNNGELATYQWEKNGKAIAGQTNRILKIANAVVSDSGQYRCVVKNNCRTVQTKIVTVKVEPKSNAGGLTLATATLDAGTMKVCETKTVDMPGLLVNDSDKPIIITSVTTEPQGVVSVPTNIAPITVPAKGTAAVQILISPAVIGAIDGSVTFSYTGGSKTLQVLAQAVNALLPETDTVRYATDISGENKCAILQPVNCDNVIISNITLKGEASEYTLGTIALPVTLTKNEPFSICVTTNKPGTSSVVLEVLSNAGTATFQLVRDQVSSVDDEVVEKSSISIIPNPTSETIRFLVGENQAASIRIVSITGATVQTLQGVGEVVWNLTDFSGSRLPSGVYVAIVSRNGNTIMEKILVND